MQRKSGHVWRIPAGLVLGVIFWSLVAYLGVHPLFG